MADTADVVVVGGGVVGASTAYHLTATGAGKVVLLERTNLAAGATGKSGALVRMHYTNPYDAALAQHSLPYFQHWQDVVGGDGDPHFVKTGMIRFIRPGQEEALRTNIAMLRELGIDTYTIDRHQVKELLPCAFVDDVTIAGYEVESGYADPIGTVYGFVARARELGADIRTGVAATTINVENDRVIGIETTAGPISTRSVVLATGAWSTRLLSPLHIDYGLQADRIQVVIFRRPEEGPTHHPIWIDGINSIWVREEGSQSTLAGFDRDQFGIDPDFFDESVDWDYRVEARRRLAARIPTMEHAIMRGGWAGVITCSPDGHAIIEQSPAYPGLYLCLGDSGTNFKTAPAIGKCLAEWIVDGSPRTVDLTPFRGSRFAEGTTICGGVPYGDSSSISVFR